MESTMRDHHHSLGLWGALPYTLPGVAVAALVLCTVGWRVAQPADPDLALTLTRDGGRVMAVLPALLALVIVVAAVGTAIGGRRVPEAGIFAAAVGLAALALRGGSMEVMLAYLDSPAADARRRLMAAMALDALLWTLLLAAAWIAVILVQKWLWTPADAEPHADPRLPKKPAKAAPAAAKAWADWWAAIVTGVIAIFIIWMTAARTPVANVARGQVIASVAAGFYVGAFTARYFTGITKPHWYLLAVPAVALISYLCGYLYADMSWAENSMRFKYYADLVTTPPHSLVRPLPVEYLAVGTAGVLAGIWSGTKVEHVVEQDAS